METCTFFQAVTCEDRSPNSQVGLRTGFSMEHALFDATEFTRRNLDIALKVIGIFLDFSKAFDMVNHYLLLRKSERYGIRKVSLWFFK